MYILYSQFRRAILTSMALAVVFVISPAAPTQANTLANDATVLNYLVEMERQTGKGCNNEPIKLPSLLPSSDLMEIADIIATSDTSLDEILTLRGMDKASVYSAFVNANSAQEAVKKLRQSNCSQLLSSRYSRIGANQQGTKWTILMAGEQRLPSNEASSDIIVNPYEPSETSQPGGTSVQGSQAAGQDQGADRKAHGKYSDGEPVFLPEKSEHRDPATPQVTGVYTDDTLTPVRGAQPVSPQASPAPSSPAKAVKPAPQVKPVPQAKPAPSTTPVPPALAPQKAPQQPAASAKSTAPATPNRQAHGKYSDGEPVFLPEQSEHRDAATPQVTGVYDDYTLTPEKVAPSAPAAPLAPEPYYPESNRDPNDAAPPQTTGVYVD